MKKILSVILSFIMVAALLVTPVLALDYPDEEYTDPFEGLEVTAMKVSTQYNLIEKYSGWYETCPKDGEKYFYYNVSDIELTFEVTYEDGRGEVASADGLYEMVEFVDDQEENHWDVGVHSVTAIYRGFEAEFEVEVVPTDVESITAVAQKPLIKDFDSWEDSYFDDEDNEIVFDRYDVYLAEPIFTITMKNGDVYVGTDKEIFDQTGEYTYEVYDQAGAPLEIGKNEVVFTYLGAECVCEIEVVENPYKSIELSGENEIILTFVGKNAADTKTVSIVDVFIWYEDEDGLVLDLYDEDGKSYSAKYYCKVEDDAYYIANNVSIEIAGLRSNELEVNNWLDARVSAEMVVDAALSMWQAGADVGGKEFENYSSDSETFNADQLLAIATYMVNPEYEDVDDYCVRHTIDAETAAALVKAVFNRDVDASQSVFYDKNGDTLVIDQYFGAAFYEIKSMTYTDGKWTMKADVISAETEEKVARVFVVLSTDGFVEEIKFRDVAPVKGDMNDDGEVTTVDARFILQYVANLRTMTEAELAIADLDGSGKVDIIDARWALQVAAGLRKI